MARYESKLVGGYFPLSNQHWAPFISLFTADAGARSLDPFAGGDDPNNGGNFHHTFANALGMEAYANEIDGARAASLIPLYGDARVVRGPAEHLSLPLNSMSFLYANPPYDNDTVENKRLELNLLDLTWKYLQFGGVVAWVVYKSHLTDKAAMFFATRCDSATVFAFPGLHQGEYKQIAVVGVKSTATRTEDQKEALYNDIRMQRDNMTVLDHALPAPLFKIPASNRINQWYFTSQKVDTEKMLRFLNTGENALTGKGFMADTRARAIAKTQQSVHPARPGHTALILGGGILDGEVIETEDGDALMRASKSRTTTVVKTEELEGTKGEPVTKVTMRENTKVTITLLYGDGTIKEISGDDDILPFVAQHAEALQAGIAEKVNPIYKFDFGSHRKELNAIRMGKDGTHQLYLPQKHAAAAILEGFKVLPGILFCGQMGTGKTGMSGSLALIGAAAEAAAGMTMKHGDVTLLICPPHLAPKWYRELKNLSKLAFIQQVDSLDEMSKTIKVMNELPLSTPKFIIIKDSLIKLGAGFVPAITWGKAFSKVQVWSTDEGRYKYRTDAIPVVTCPHCGEKAKDVDGLFIQNESYFAKGKRNCEACHRPMWQEKRQLAEGEKVVSKGDQLAHALSQKTSVMPFPDLMIAHGISASRTETKHRPRLDEVVKHYLKGRVRLLIWDEVHGAKSVDTGAGVAFGRIAAMARRTLALTGTPLNGKSTSIYNIAYAMNPETRRMYPRGGAVRYYPAPKGMMETLPSSIRRRAALQAENIDFAATADNLAGASASEWVETMGVKEFVETTRSEVSPYTGQLTGTTKTSRTSPAEKPGITADLVAHLMPMSVFLALRDMGQKLPELIETTEAVPMDEEIAIQYQRVTDAVQDYCRKNMFQPGMGKTVASLRSRHAEWALGWPNAPYRDGFFEVNDPADGPTIIASWTGMNPETFMTTKEIRLVEHVREEIAQNRWCIIYVEQSKSNDIRPRITQLLNDHVPGAKPFVLNSSTATDKREGIINKAVKDGYNILITNPKLVETGLDLIDYPTIIVYEVTYVLTVLAQATRRSYRLGQKHLCKVLYLYYEGVISSEDDGDIKPFFPAEAAAVVLMSRKQRALKAFLGEMGMTGFDSLSQDDAEMNAEADLVKALAGLVVSDEVEDSAMKAVDLSDALFWNVNGWLEDDEAVAPVVEMPVVVEVIEEAVVEFVMTETQRVQDIIARAIIKMGHCPTVKLPDMPGRDWSKLQIAG